MNTFFKNWIPGLIAIAVIIGMSCLFFSISPQAVLKPAKKYNPGDITTIVLTAGQSNAVGGFSNINYNGGNQDLPNKKVYVWAANQVTGQHDWVLANIRRQSTGLNTGQVWISSEPGAHPDGRLIVNGTNNGQSHAGFQIARHIVENSNEVVGIVPTGHNAQPIEFWMRSKADGQSYQAQQPLRDIVDTVDNALASLRIDYNNANATVELVWWMQGESNLWVSKVAKDFDPIDYSIKLKAIVRYLQAQSWFSDTRPRLFIANHVFIAQTEKFQYRTDNQLKFNSMLDETLETDEFDGPNGANRSKLQTCSHVSPEPITTVDDLHYDAQTIARIGLSVSQKFLGDSPCGATVFDRSDL